MLPSCMLMSDRKLYDVHEANDVEKFHVNLLRKRMISFCLTISVLISNDSVTLINTGFGS
jgi:hypothetical protein